MDQIRKINCAEGIFAPCFDKTLTDLLQFNNSSCSISQEWDCMLIESGKESFELTWKGNLNMGEYNCIRFFINIPQYICVSGYAVAEGKEHSLFENIMGEPFPIELTGSLYENAVVTEICLCFSVKSNQFSSHKINLSWIGVLNSKIEYLIDEEIPKYNPDSWDGYINYNNIPTTQNSILFTEQELILIKSRLNEPAFAGMIQALFDNSMACENSCPEKEIREYLAVDEHLYRYTRVRDRFREPISDKLLMLAISGYLFDKKEFSLLSARMIMCIAMTPHWFEGPQCCMEGSTWHHVCFTEEHTTNAIILALGFLGNMFSDMALSVIKTALKKHWETVEKCCLERGYRQFSNQGIVGNVGRMIGACGFYSMGEEQYRVAIENCYSDHTNMINEYINEETHCVEGGGYYQYSFSKSVILWKAYALYKNIDVKDVVPRRAYESLKYLDCITSTTDIKGSIIPLNSTRGGPINDIILSLFATVFDWKRGRVHLKNRKNKTILETDGIDLIMLMRYLPKEIDGTDEGAENYYIFENSGLGAYEYESGKFWFCAERNPRTGHFHCDRGSIILEYGGEILIADPGITNYSNLLSAYMSSQKYHNLSHPENIPMKIQSDIAKKSANEAGIGCRTIVCANDFLKPSAKVNYIKPMNDGIQFSANLEQLYDERVILASREGYFKKASEGATFELCDKWKLSSPTAIFVNFLSYDRWMIGDSSATVNIKGTILTIHFTSNVPFELFLDETMSDYSLKKLYTLRLKTTHECECEIFSKGVINCI